MIYLNTLKALPALAVSLVLVACAQMDMAPVAEASPVLAAVSEEKFESDRAAILAMAGTYKVTFDFQETVAFVEGYTPKERYTTGAHEIVTVIEDSGDFISLQHILLVGGDNPMVVKHWRQDWAYQPASVLEFIGGNAWKARMLDAVSTVGQWSQTVYQVDDSPRYGAVATWTHEHGTSHWTPSATLRPLPRRDMTKRDDYHSISAVNRHILTHKGWVHEQDNAKLILSGDEPQILVREIGVNTYDRTDEVDTSVTDAYWQSTAAYWKNVRAAWRMLEDTDGGFALTVKGEPEDIYGELLSLARDVESGEKTTVDASTQAADVIDRFTTTSVGVLASRLRSTGR